jgi:hypothetical protein
MQHHFFSQGFLAGLVSILAGAQTLAAAAKPGTPVDAGRLPAGQFAGTLLSLPDADRVFTVKVHYQEVVPNPNYNFSTELQLQRQYLHILNLQMQLNNPGNRNPVNTLYHLQLDVAHFQQQLVHAQLNSVRVVHRTQEVDFQAAENMKVRTRSPGQGYDDKGNIKKYTPAELKVLKGKNPNLPGYESDVEALKTGMPVLVTLAPHHAQPPPAPAAVDKDKGSAQKPAPKDKAPQKKMQVQMVLILDDTAADAPAPKGANKKKNGD